MACGYSTITTALESCGGQRATKGIKDLKWVANFGAITSTLTNNKATLITGVAFDFTGYKDNANVGSDATISDIPTGFKHFFQFKDNNKTAAARLMLDKADNISVIVEANGSKTEGCFLMYGQKNGLWKKTQSQKANDDNGQTNLEFETREGMEEDYSAIVVWNTDYATTLSMLNGLSV
jgi:hypothetical protein